MFSSPARSQAQSHAPSPSRHSALRSPGAASAVSDAAVARPEPLLVSFCVGGTQFTTTRCGRPHASARGARPCARSPAAHPCHRARCCWQQLLAFQQHQHWRAAHGPMPAERTIKRTADRCTTALAACAHMAHAAAQPVELMAKPSKTGACACSHAPQGHAVHTRPWQPPGPHRQGRHALPAR